MPQPPFTLPPQYDPRDVEGRLYQGWLERGVFTARADSPREPYVIVMPPPNITAILHTGQGLNNVIQDVLIRFERMRRREALWLPGTDHAGIATQNVVERLVAKEGKTRFELGREQFVERVWAFVRETGSTILEQLKVIGSSCDWSRTRFTLDPAYSRAVREVFVQLWEEGLIYRGHRVIHWCPHCLTALSDEEAVFADEAGKLYYIRYPVEGGPQPFLTVATTRPETILGDTAVAVHPEDGRHAGFIGKTARLPIANLPIPIVADDTVDPAFGTGFVKVTPAHDANDFEIGTRHKLEMPLIMQEDGRRRRSGGRAVRRSGAPGDRPTAGPPDRPTCPARAAGPGPVRRPREDRSDARGRGAAREGRATHARRASLLPLRHGGGAEVVRSMVREDATAGRAGARGLPERGVQDRPGALARDVRELDGEHPGLEYLAAAVVGPPHPRVHVHAVPAPVGRSRGPGTLPQVRRSRDPGPRRAGHLVLVLAVAVRDARLARAHRGPGAVLPGAHPRDGPGDPVLLGGPDADVRLPLHGPDAAVHDRLPARHGARHPAPQDVQVARQRHRPTRRGADVRRGRTALDAHRRELARRGRDSRPE